MAYKTGDIIKRKHFVILLDASMGGETPEWVAIGKDNDSLAIDHNPDTENSKNVLGETTFRHNGEEKSFSVDPYMVRFNDALGKKLQEACENDLFGDDLKTKCMIVYMNDNTTADPDTTGSTGYTAKTQDANIVINSEGGGTDGFAVPFSVVLSGTPTKGKAKKTGAAWSFTEGLG